MTVIKISNHLKASFDVSRIVWMDNLEVIENGDREQIKNYSKSKLAE
jgi:hypothetical protein